jgi:hypothetical protein
LVRFAEEGAYASEENWRQFAEEGAYASEENW